MDRRALGRIGEAAAAAALAAQGYEIVQRNARTRYGEIDLVALQRGEVVFIEVKTRTSGEYGQPFDAVSPAKQRRLSRLARAFMHRRGWGNRACRFDVAAVMVSPAGRVLGVEILPNAFEAPA